MKHDLTKPCKECPYVGNMPGWIGAHQDPQEFVDLAKSDSRFPCHQTIDYEDPAWSVKVASGDVQQCVGQLAFMNRDFKLSRTREVAQHQDLIARDKSIVILWPPEFLVAVHRAGQVSAKLGIEVRDAGPAKTATGRTPTAPKLQRPPTRKPRK